MNRRAFLALGGATTLGAVAGCLGSDAEAANEFDYETNPTEQGIDVPLVPVEDAYEWFENDEARFADARGRDQYDQLRILDAVFSPAPDGADDDPVEEWSTDTRIVTYCRCPHHLSSARAASLIDAGYEHTYAIDEGLTGWVANAYPVEGSDVDADWERYVIEGTTDPEHAGDMATLEQLDADRQEMAPIEDDGSYAIRLYFTGSPDSEFRVETPEYTVEGTLEELSNETITG